MYYKLIYVLASDQGNGVQPTSEEFVPGEYLIQLIRQQEDLYTCVKIPVSFNEDKPRAVGIYDASRDSIVFIVWVYKGWKGNVTFALSNGFRLLSSEEADQIDITAFVSEEESIELWGGRNSL